MPISQAKVKSVVSGDTLILTSVNNPSQERTLSLAFVSAPRMRREGDEVSVPSFLFSARIVYRMKATVDVFLCSQPSVSFRIRFRLIGQKRKFES